MNRSNIAFLRISHVILSYPIGIVSDLFICDFIRKKFISAVKLYLIDLNHLNVIYTYINNKEKRASLKCPIIINLF